MRSEPNRYGTRAAYGFALVDGEADARPRGAAPVKVTAPGPTIVLKRDEPVEITLKNELAEASAVHWHGMELESYYDGVHEFGGVGQQRTPLINPGESFVVKFTPPRAGTFMYHTHMHDDHQLSTGMYGAMLVMDPAETYDPETDHALVIGVDGIGSRAGVVLNGSKTAAGVVAGGAEAPDPAGEHHASRHRVDRAAQPVRTSSRGGRSPRTASPCRRISAAPRKAEQLIGVGETYDFEYDAPAAREDLWIEAARHRRTLLAAGQGYREMTAA